MQRALLKFIETSFRKGGAVMFFESMIHRIPHWLSVFDSAPLSDLALQI